MSLLHQRTRRRKSNDVLPAVLLQKSQRGVVLVVALILLVVVSLLAATAVRNSDSNEAVAGNVRTTELAMEAAEIALRYCEDLVLKIPKSPEEETDDKAKRNHWASRENWDKKPDMVYVFPLDLLKQSNIQKTYSRSSECMFEKIFMPKEIVQTSTNGSRFYLVTARGFGPEVAEVDKNRSRPVGTEIWLQTHIEIQ